MQRMIVNVITAERPYGARLKETLVDQEKRAVERFMTEVNEWTQGGWVPMGPMVLMERLMVQQFYAMIEVDDESDEEE